MPKFRQLSDRVAVNVALAPVSKSAGTTTSSAINLTGYSNASLLVDFEIPVGKPFVKTVLVNATAAAVQGVFIIADQDTRN